MLIFMQGIKYSKGDTIFQAAAGIFCPEGTEYSSFLGIFCPGDKIFQGTKYSITGLKNNAIVWAR